MDMYRAFLAIIISFVILVGYQYLFMKPSVEHPAPQQQAQDAETAPQVSTEPAAGQPVVAVPVVPAVETVQADPTARDIQVDTPLYTAVFSEQGGGLKSFVLKEYRKEKKGDTSPMELVQTSQPAELPMLFSLQGDTPGGLLRFRADREQVTLGPGDGPARLTLTATLAGQVEVVRTLNFDPETYLIEDTYQLRNVTSAPVMVQPAVLLHNRPFLHKNAASRYMFSGPVALVNGELSEVKGKKLLDGPRTIDGSVSWAAYEDNYFITAVLPEPGLGSTVKMSIAGETVRTVVGSGSLSLDPAAEKKLTYAVYFGPKKLSFLKAVGHDLARAINFGWFDVLAKPMLWLLNFFHAYIGNYGVAIILLTILIKGVFWPITQKGMKSMKNMQKLQPKVARLKEKFKDDPQKMNQEMMALYKTYKVNPLGCCLPMLLQIPFFFALYKVLLMSIELRHAPFMLWINDLSAPDRLWIGFDIPYLHGIPVLTLLMGASMFLQQKMTPTTADPTQARIMQMLPIIFTFMFLNFASGLVLYWFVNNLLSILQQQIINRQTKS